MNTTELRRAVNVTLPMLYAINTTPQPQGGAHTFPGNVLPRIRNVKTQTNKT